MHEGLTVGIDRENTSPYLLVAKGAHTITRDLHNCFPLVTEFIFDLFHEMSVQTSRDERNRDDLIKHKKMFVIKYNKNNLR